MATPHNKIGICIASIAILMICYAGMSGCNGTGRDRVMDIGIVQTKESNGYNCCDTINKSDTMPNRDNCAEGQGASSGTIQPAENTPENDQVFPGKDEPQQIIGIGIPMSREDMDSLKEAATKLDP